MSLQTITRVTVFNRWLIVFAVLAFDFSHADWKVDFSRRMKSSRSADLREPASELPIQSSAPQPEPGFFESLLSSGEPVQEMVVLNTDAGFVPSTLRVRQGSTYKIHVVNVNEKERNISFVLDAFSEHHATFYGKIRTFTIRPQKEGVFRYISPETSAQGKLIVLPAGSEMRVPASASE